MSVIPYLRGWEDSREEIVRESVESNRLYMLDMDFTNACNLGCPYCYRAEYGEQSHKRLDSEVGYEEALDLIGQAADLGCRSVKVVGAGEPAIDPDFLEKVGYISEKGMIPVVFTNGIQIAREEDLSSSLYQLDASVVLKVNSLRPEVQDMMVGRPGYTEERGRALDVLMGTGFNDHEPTRLGFDSVITIHNREEIPDLFRYCRQNNIFPIFKSFIPTGDALKRKDWELKREEMAGLYQDIRRIDEGEFGIVHDGELPYAGGFPCNQIHYALYVDVEGNVYSCPGSRELLGNIREKGLGEIWNSERAVKIRGKPYDGCPPREVYWRQRAGQNS